ncbi:hypothetical protein TRVA0_045S00386 [Trichomonascus vanleenenianus]|uniref:Yhc1p n=1 Tax=Trichomonascus vanleenenianus TaxID=2268995 RepID=UPI003ECB040F
MPKIRYYTCDYCGVALTHDSTSVRKSHTVGRNHVKYVIDYYENAAKEEGLLPPDLPSSTDPASGVDTAAFQTLATNPLDQTKELKVVNEGVPGLSTSFSPTQLKINIPKPAGLE